MQSPTTAKQTSQKLTSPGLPLAVYREVAAHLRQVEGVDTSLIMRSLEHDPSEQFDYYQSQIAALEITYSDKFTNADEARVSEILDYYAQRYSPWLASN